MLSKIVSLESQLRAYATELSNVGTQPEAEAEAAVEHASIDDEYAAMFQTTAQSTPRKDIKEDAAITPKKEQVTHPQTRARDATWSAQRAFCELTSESADLMKQKARVCSIQDDELKKETEGAIELQRKVFERKMAWAKATQEVAKKAEERVEIESTEVTHSIPINALAGGETDAKAGEDDSALDALEIQSSHRVALSEQGLASAEASEAEAAASLHEALLTEAEAASGLQSHPGTLVAIAEYRAVGIKKKEVRVF